MDENKWFTQEMRRLDLQHQQMTDHYNTLEKVSDLNDDTQLINSHLKYAPQEHHTWETYAKELATHVKYADDKNTKTHIQGKRPWYTHRSPLGCFMCEDIAMRHVMLSVIISMAKQHPNTSF